MCPMSERTFFPVLACQTFAVLSATLWESTYIGAIAPFSMLILMTGFEILVSFLQAFIFTILTAVYMGGAIHPEH